MAPPTPFPPAGKVTATPSDPRASLPTKSLPFTRICDPLPIYSAPPSVSLPALCCLKPPVIVKPCSNVVAWPPFDQKIQLAPPPSIVVTLDPAPRSCTPDLITIGNDSPLAGP